MYTRWPRPLGSTPEMSRSEASALRASVHQTPQLHRQPLDDGPAHPAASSHNRRTQHWQRSLAGCDAGWSGLTPVDLRGEDEWRGATQRFRPPAGQEGGRGETVYTSYFARSAHAIAESCVRLPLVRVLSMSCRSCPSIRARESRLGPEIELGWPGWAEIREGLEVWGVVVKMPFVERRSRSNTTCSSMASRKPTSNRQEWSGGILAGERPEQMDRRGMLRASSLSPSIDNSFLDICLLHRGRDRNKSRPRSTPRLPS